MGNLAELLAEKGEHREAELLFREILQVERERLGPRHPDTLGSMQRLAGVLQDEGRVNEAERLAREALRLKREVLGSRHPDTLSSMEQLAIIWQLQGRYSESDVLYPELLKGSMETFGAAHPNTLLTQLRRVANLAAQGHVKEAVAPLREMEPNLLTWLGVELYTTQAVAVRRRFVASQSIYQDSALSLALLAGAPEEAVELAASVVLHFKELAVEEETFLAHLVRHGSDPRIRELASTIAGLHDQLARVFHTAGSRDQVPRLTAELDAKELELSRLSRGFAQTLQVRTATLHELRNKLPSGSGLLEIRLYYPVDFKTLSEPGEARCAGILITSTGVIQVKDLGTVAAAAEAVDALVNKASSEEARDRATRALYGQLITPFAKEIAELDRLYVAPDGGFYLVPLGALRGPDGHRLLEVKDVRLIQTGRDLLRAPPEQQGRGLLAMGGIDFGPVPTSEMQPPVAQSVRHQLQAMPVAEAMRPRQQVRAMGWSLDAGMIEHLRAVTADNLRGGFGPLPRSREEVEGIGLLYGAARPDEPPPEVIIGDRATKARLTELGAPPRVVHLATHGFYRAGREPADRPLLLSGIAFAGANRALHDPDQGGILYAIEALDLNLEGTELVVLSACETAQGQIEYGEGVSGMVRALRTAGARSVLVTLRPVDDAGAADFMQLFYHHWLSQVHDDLAAALRDTQRDYLKPNTARSDDPIWSSFILIGG